MDFWIVAMLLGGLGLFLYGMKLMSDGLEALAGDKLRNGLEKLTKNRFAAVGIGTGITALIQSSSATTVMVVGFVNAGLMSLSNAIHVGLGANIGTTITAQIVSFKITELAPIILFVGVIILLFSKKRSLRRLGEAIGGLGILFFGMNVMSEAIAPLRDYQPFIDMIATFEEPWIGLLAGAGITMIIQSSSATMGIAQALAMQGVFGLESAVYVILGLNIGTCITAILASLGASKTAKRTALALLLFNIIGSMLFMILLQTTPIVDWVASWTPGDDVRQMANFHTFFNIVMVAIFLFVPWVLPKIVCFLIRGEDKKQEGRKLEFLVSPLPEVPTVVVGLAMKETERMMKMANDNFTNAIKAFMQKDEKLVHEIMDNEKTVNYLDHEITEILARLSGKELSEGDMLSVSQTLHAVMNIERISDIAENIADLAMHRVEGKIKIGKKAEEEITYMASRAEEALQLAIKVLQEKDVTIAARVVEIEDEVDELELKLKKNHIKRLRKGECSAVASTVFTDLVSMIERIADHSSSIAEGIIKEDVV